MERNNWVGDFDFDLQLYLRRIGHVPEVEPTIECLKILHFHQLHTIPFENFDIQLNRSIDLTPEVQFRKLIFDSRGGYCFELNGLFLAAIRKAGFDARPLLGRVHVTGEVTGRGHQISLITIDNEPWIADVGFGADTPRCPFPLKINAPITSGAQTIQIIESKEYGFIVQAFKSATWIDLYSFDLGHVCRGDIEYGNYYTATSPNSFFTGARIAVLPTATGYWSLFNNTFTCVEDGKEERAIVEAGDQYMELLEKRFGIKLNTSFDAFREVAN